MKPELGMRVRVSKVFQFPDRDKWDDLDVIQMTAIDNPLADQVAVVVGVSRKKYYGEVRYYCIGDGGPFTGGSEGYSVDMLPSRKTFFVVRYTLTGGRYYTTPEYMKEA